MVSNRDECNNFKILYTMVSTMIFFLLHAASALSPDTCDGTACASKSSVLLQRAKSTYAAAPDDVQRDTLNVLKQLEVKMQELESQLGTHHAVPVKAPISDQARNFRDDLFEGCKAKKQPHFAPTAKAVLSQNEVKKHNDDNTGCGAGEMTIYSFSVASEDPAASCCNASTRFCSGCASASQSSRTTSVCPVNVWVHWPVPAFQIFAVPS